MQMLLAAISFIVFFASLTGCMPLGLPAMFVDVPALTYMSYGKNAFDVASFTGSGKSLSDHMLSSMTGRDCAMVNIFEGNVCPKKDFWTIAPVGQYRFDHLYFKIEKPKESLNRFRS